MSENDDLLMREKLKDLRASLNNRFCRWDDWERQFILNIARQINEPVLDITPKQYVKINALWERSLK